MAYDDLSDERKKAIANNAKEWLKKNRVGLVSNVKPSTRALFDDIHEQLISEGKVKSREDTVIYLCHYFTSPTTRP